MLSTTRILAVAVLLLGAVHADGTKRALIFGLGQQADSRWGKINGDRDVYYVKQLLLAEEFTDIVSLTNQRATKQAMVRAFRQLEGRCQRGDMVYVHYSGHGQLVTDLNGDEARKWTGSHAEWDESWVPYDAQMVYGDGDHGECHLTDDEVAVLLAGIRGKIGPQGRLIVVVDACHSCDATCGPEDEPVRGVDTKFCIPRQTGHAACEEIDEHWLTISACKPYQLSAELKQERVGKLTFALFKLGRRVFTMSNDELQKHLEDFMLEHKGRMPQTPMVTGKEQE